MKKIAIRLSLFSCSLLLMSGCTFSSDALFPSLLGSDSQEESVKDGSIYSSLKKDDVPQLGSTNFEPIEVKSGSNTGTFVGQKVVTFRNELAQLQTAIRNHNEELQKIRGSVINNALQYHKTIGTIEAKLQVGTTPGNPQMYAMLQNAQSNIQVMNNNTNSLSQLSSRVASDAAMTTYLLDSIKAAYTVSGAVDEDHRQLRILENETNQTSILINSLLSEINADTARQKQYIDTASNYIADLSNAIKVGSYGVNNSPLVSSSVAPAFYRQDAAASGKPLFVAKFNKSNVNYKDGLKRAVSSALQKKPGVMFEVVAVNPTNGTQLAKSNARNHASDIFQEMVSMGVGADKIALTARSSAEATSSEVQIYVK
ncbi:MAG: hypothetical protein J6A33_03845 [Alphaproteobacteria bacterium]|nr:hypothetical protein [Alphaproteobacteria bacterium]